MPNTYLEAALRAIGDGARLEQLASDVLRREGYSVNPTETRGPCIKLAERAIDYPAIPRQRGRIKDE